MILPGQGGVFNDVELVGGSHYEVYGESTTDGEPREGSASNFNQQPSARFSFRRPSTATASSAGGFPPPRSTGQKMSQR